MQRASADSGAKCTRSALVTFNNPKDCREGIIKANGQDTFTVRFENARKDATCSLYEEKQVESLLRDTKLELEQMQEQERAGTEEQSEQWEEQPWEE